jgi:hypothetical protein
VIILSGLPNALDIIMNLPKMCQFCRIPIGEHTISIKVVFDYLDINGDRESITLTACSKECLRDELKRRASDLLMQSVGYDMALASL